MTCILILPSGQSASICLTCGTRSGRSASRAGRDVRRASRLAKSTARLLSGSVSVASKSSVPWKKSGTPGVHTFKSVSAREFETAAGAIARTNRPISVRNRLVATGAGDE